MFPLCRERLVLRDHRPAVRQHPHVAATRVDHGLDGEGHAFAQLEAGAGPAIVEDLRVLVIDPADAVAAVLAHHRVLVALGEGLDGVADVAEEGAGLDHADAAPHGLVTGIGEPTRQHRHVADRVHAAGVAMPAVADDGDVDVQDVAALQGPVVRDAVADDMIHGGADGLREAAVIEVRGHGFQLVDDELVTAPVELLGAHAGLDEGLDHVEHARGEPAGEAHLLLFLGRFDGDVELLEGLCFHKKVMV